MPMIQTPLRFTALRQADDRALREGVAITAYKEVCDGVTAWHVRSAAEGPPQPQERGVVTAEYTAHPGEEE